MGETTGGARQHVVNLAEYRAARAARALPLFDPGADTGPALPSAPLTPPPARPLLPREVEHRARMLRHLASGT